MAVSGVAVAYACIGGVVVYSGITGIKLTPLVQNVLKGKLPSAGNLPPADVRSVQFGTGSPAGSSGSGGVVTGGTASASAAANQALARQIIQGNPAYAGWDTGQEWTDLVQLWTRESGWSATAKNPQSGAYGIAQALGHGPTNQYPAGPANPPTSDPGAQISWGLDYIKTTYGSPVLAWAHETSAGWY